MILANEVSVELESVFARILKLGIRSGGGSSIQIFYLTKSSNTTL